MSEVEGRFAGRLGRFALDAELAFPARGVTALVGPSGCGKTTLLRCIAGLTRLPGRLSVAGDIWQDERRFLAPHRRPAGMVFQEPSLLPHLTVRGNLAYADRRARGAPLTNFAEAVELLGLSGLLDRAPGKLSGGERQRVALARALLTRPTLLLMDEPLSSLDAASKADILPYLDRLHRTLAIPTLYVTHDLSEVARLADHRLDMREGRIVGFERDLRADGGGDLLAALSPAQIRALAEGALRAGFKP